MTDRELMQQALHTLEGWANHGKWVWPESALEQAQRNTTESITALRERLAQPEQEPFGYFQYDPRLDAWVQNREGRSGTPFYTTPPQRKPLTDDEIERACVPLGAAMLSFTEVARAIEAAHGIKGEA